MPGFYISNIIRDVDLRNSAQENCIKNYLCVSRYTIKSNTLNKFMSDKAFFQDDHYVYILDGYLLNKKELLEKYGCTNVVELMRTLISGGDKAFFRQFRGSFSGALLNKVEDSWTVFTNHFGDQPIYYYCVQNEFIIASQFNYIVDAARETGRNLNVNENAAYNILTYGYMPDEQTYACEIKKLEFGCYLEIVKNEMKKNNYYTINNSAFDLSEKTSSQIVGEMDSLFRKSVALEFEKDREFGYRHLVDLSGGLDSRMVSWVATSLGYTNILNISYGQMGCRDQRLAQQVSKALGTDFLFKSLDSLSFMLDIDETTRMNYGSTLYTMSTGSNEMLELLDTRRFGISHTGLIGDSVIGTYAYRDRIYPETDRSIMYSTYLEDRVGYTRKYSSFDTECLCKRGINGIMTSLIIRRNYVEASTPFANVEFLDYCMSIPLKMRHNHGIYLEWLRSVYPEAGDIIWDKTGLKPNASRTAALLAKMNRKWKKLTSRVTGLCENEQRQADAMNPFQFWFNESSMLRDYMDSYYYKHIVCGAISERLREDMRMLYLNGSALEKCQVLTVLSAMSSYFEKQQ